LPLAFTLFSLQLHSKKSKDMTHVLREDIISASSEIADFSFIDSLQKRISQFSGRLTVSTRRGIKYQVLTHYIATNQLDFPLFTSDTGRLFQQTNAGWNSTLNRKEINFLSYYSYHISIAHYSKTKGLKAFYASIDDRKECCFLSKAENRKRALTGKAVCLTALRAAQSLKRQNVDWLKWEESKHLIKLNPLWHRNTEEVLPINYTINIPNHQLHDQGFVRIVCKPSNPAINSREVFSLWTYC